MQNKSIIFYYLNMILNNYVIFSFPICFFVLFIFFNFEKIDYTNPTTFTKVETSQLKITSDNYLLSCTLYVPVETCFNGSLNTLKNKNVLLLGNSQNMSTIVKDNINNHTVIKYLYDNLKESAYLPISLAFPNANLQEQYFVLETVSKKIKLDTVILPIFLDDTRENGLRDDVKNYIGKGDDVSSTNKEINELIGIAKLSIYTDKYLPYWNKRIEIKNSIEYNLYLLRNFIFNIQKSSNRRIIKSYYLNNLNYFEKIIDFTNKNNIKLIAYIAPIPPGAKIYDNNEYNEFLNYLKKINSNNYSLYDLNDSIPKTDWAINPSKRNEYIDYMHFDGNGHKLLGNILTNIMFK